MPDIGIISRDLFSEIDDLATSAERFILNQMFLETAERISRTEWCFENLPRYESVMLDLEDTLLLNEALHAFIYGLYVSVIISSDAYCERILTDVIEFKGDMSSAKSGLGKIIKSSENYKILDPYILSRIRRIHNIRNNFCHEKGPDHSLRLFQRSISQRAHHMEFLKSDAAEALCIIHGITSTLRRSFPRLALPGIGLFAKAPQ